MLGVETNQLSIEAPEAVKLGAIRTVTERTIHHKLTFKASKSMLSSSFTHRKKSASSFLLMSDLSTHVELAKFTGLFSYA